MDSLTRSYGREKDSLERVYEYPLPENPMIDPGRQRKKKNTNIGNTIIKKQTNSQYR